MVIADIWNNMAIFNICLIVYINSVQTATHSNVDHSEIHSGNIEFDNESMMVHCVLSNAEMHIGPARLEGSVGEKFGIDWNDWMLLSIMTTSEQ